MVLVTFRMACKHLASLSHRSIRVSRYSIHWFTNAFSSAEPPTYKINMNHLCDVTCESHTCVMKYVNQLSAYLSSGYWIK